MKLWIGVGLALLVAASGCKQKQPLAPGPAGDDLKLSARLDRTKCEVGDTVQVEVELHNAGARPHSVTGLRLDIRSIDLEVEFKGKTAHLQRFYPTRTRAVGPREVTLKPGRSLPLKVPFPALQSGNYKIAVHFHGRPHDLQAPPLELKVTPQVSDGEEHDRLMARIETEFGPIEIKLLAAESLGTVYNFVVRAREGLFDGVTFHKLPRWPAPVVVAGKREREAGEPYAIPTETGGPEPDRGTVAMGEPVLPPPQARPGSEPPLAEDSETAGSHFFIYVRKPPGNAPTNTPFAQVISGMWVVDKLHRLPTRGRGPEQDEPLRQVKIQQVTIKPW